MSLTRAEIVAALTGIDGLFPSEYRPTVIASGQAWPSIGGIRPAQAGIFETYWKVCVVLGADDKAAAMQWEALVGPVFTALYAVAAVDQVEILPTSVDTGQFYCAVFIVRS